MAHGLTASKVISINCSVIGTDNNYYNMTYFSSGIVDARTYWNSSNIIIYTSDAIFQSRTYRCIAIYIPWNHN